MKESSPEVSTASRLTSPHSLRERLALLCTGASVKSAHALVSEVTRRQRLHPVSYFLTCFRSSNIHVGITLSCMGHETCWTDDYSVTSFITWFSIYSRHLCWGGSVFTSAGRSDPFFWNLAGTYWMKLIIEMSHNCSFLLFEVSCQRFLRFFLYNGGLWEKCSVGLRGIF